MKRFIKEAGGVDSYEDVDVVFKPGVNPTVIITNEDNTENERIAIKDMTFAELHLLFRKRGYVSRKPVSTDDHEHCKEWASKGECSRNPEFMRKTCVLSCDKHILKNEHNDCGYWAKNGECANNPQFMFKRCESACKDEL